MSLQLAFVLACAFACMRVQAIDSSSSSSLSSSFKHLDAPKIIPLSALDKYAEGSDLKLFCSTSSGNANGKLTFEWRKNAFELLSTTTTTTSSQALDAQQQQQQQHRLTIQTIDDSSTSVLRVNSLQARDSGNYTCTARNAFGADSSTVRVDVNVRLKWTKEPPAEARVRVGKSTQLECDASGQPAPQISWTSVKDKQTINSRILRFDRATLNDSGLYECRAVVADSQHSNKAAASIGGEVLRKIVRLTVDAKRHLHAKQQTVNVHTNENYYVHQLINKLTQKKTYKDEVKEALVGVEQFTLRHQRALLCLASINVAACKCVELQAAATFANTKDLQDVCVARLQQLTDSCGGVGKVSAVCTTQRCASTAANWLQTQNSSAVTSSSSGSSSSSSSSEREIVLRFLCCESNRRRRRRRLRRANANLIFCCQAKICNNERKPIATLNSIELAATVNNCSNESMARTFCCKHLLAFFNTFSQTNLDNNKLLYEKQRRRRLPKSLLVNEVANSSLFATKEEEEEEATMAFDETTQLNNTTVYNNVQYSVDNDSLQCALFDGKLYVAYSALGSFYMPMLVMIFFYSRIYVVAARAQRDLKRGYMTAKALPVSNGALIAARKSCKASLKAHLSNSQSITTTSTTGNVVVEQQLTRINSTKSACSNQLQLTCDKLETNNDNSTCAIFSNIDQQLQNGEPQKKVVLRIHRPQKQRQKQVVVDKCASKVCAAAAAATTVTNSCNALQTQSNACGANTLRTTTAPLLTTAANVVVVAGESSLERLSKLEKQLSINATTTTTAAATKLASKPLARVAASLFNARRSIKRTTEACQQQLTLRRKFCKQNEAHKTSIDDLSHELATQKNVCKQVATLSDNNQLIDECSAHAQFATVPPRCTSTEAVAITASAQCKLEESRKVLITVASADSVDSSIETRIDAPPVLIEVTPPSAALDSSSEAVNQSVNSSSSSSLSSSSLSSSSSSIISHSSFKSNTKRSSNNNNNYLVDDADDDDDVVALNVGHKGERSQSVFAGESKTFKNNSNYNDNNNDSRFDRSNSVAQNAQVLINWNPNTNIASSQLVSSANKRIVRSDGILSAPATTTTTTTTIPATLATHMASATIDYSGRQHARISSSLSASARQKSRSIVHSYHDNNRLLVGERASTACDFSSSSFNTNNNNNNNNASKLRANSTAGSNSSLMQSFLEFPVASANRVRKHSVMLINSLTTRGSKTLRHLSIAASHPVDSLLKRKHTSADNINNIVVTSTKSSNNSKRLTNNNKFSIAVSSQTRRNNKQRKGKKRKKQRIDSKCQINSKSNALININDNDNKSSLSLKSKRTFDDYLMGVAGIDSTDSEQLDIDDDDDCEYCDEVYCNEINNQNVNQLTSSEEEDLDLDYGSEFKFKFVAPRVSKSIINVKDDNNSSNQERIQNDKNSDNILMHANISRKKSDNLIKVIVVNESESDFQRRTASSDISAKPNNSALNSSSSSSSLIKKKSVSSINQNEQQLDSNKQQQQLNALANDNSPQLAAASTATQMHLKSDALQEQPTTKLVVGIQQKLSIDNNLNDDKTVKIATIQSTEQSNNNSTQIKQNNSAKKSGSNTARRGMRRFNKWHAKRLHERRFLAEYRVAGLIAVIVGCFCVCWSPFFTTYLVRSVVCESSDCVSRSLLSFFTWLGYFNSALNPVIYGLFSSDFRAAFKDILFNCKILRRSKKQTKDSAAIATLVDSILKSVS